MYVATVSQPYPSFLLFLLSLTPHNSQLHRQRIQFVTVQLAKHLTRNP